MNKLDFRLSQWARALGLALLAAVLGGCASDIGGPSYGYYEQSNRPIGYDGPGYAAPAPAPVVTYQQRGGGYDYYPEHEVYFDRTRREYIYVENNTWVRAPRPRFDVNVLLSAPSVHLEFRDSPAYHHRDVIRTYPRGWRRHDNRHDRRYDPRFDPRNDPRNDPRYERRW